jgi:tRNA nucleotidyltransferase/poly(A) polymerase
MERVNALLNFLAHEISRVGAAEHTYVVGGAVRNTLLGLAPKDLDIVVDSEALGFEQDSAWLARQLQSVIPVRTNLTTNQYGVAILTVSESWDLEGFPMKGEVLEIANARRESYGKGGKGYKPTTVEAATIREDLLRRDFTVNTLLWRMSDLAQGHRVALDLLGTGLADLAAKELCTPCDPDTTFSDDPTRMLRAVKFMAKYGLQLHPETALSIARNAEKLLQMPCDAVRKILVDDILLASNPRDSLMTMTDLSLVPVLAQLLNEQPGFQAAVSRGLQGVCPLLMLDLLDLGLNLRGTFSGFLSGQELDRLREVLETHSDPTRFVEALQRPPVNQVALFARHSLNGPARQQVVKVARRLLLENPELLSSSEDLESAVSAHLA